MTNARYFNSLAINYKEQTICKSSRDKKLQYEIEWYKKIPIAMRKYIPEIYDYGTEPENFFIKMRYYNDLTLSDYFLDKNSLELLWIRIFEKIKDLLDDFNKFRLASTIRDRRETLYYMYIKKTLDRLYQFKLQNVIEFEKPLTINGRKYLSINDYINKLYEIAIKYQLLECDCFSLIHGDLCFPNIIYSKKESNLVLIDPRGSFGKYDIYGDRRYEFAKLYHSLHGLYDCIVNDYFVLNKFNTNIDISIRKTKNQQIVNLLFENLLSQLGIELQQINLINILLFLSKIPLHKDNISHQLAFISVGVMELDKYINN